MLPPPGLVFTRLIQQLLTETEERLAGWRVRLSEALGANGGVLTEVIPEIELIVGLEKQWPNLPLEKAMESLLDGLASRFKAAKRRLE